MNKHDIIINFVKSCTVLSKCKDKKTAAILMDVDMTQIYSLGLNGGPKGGINCLCSKDESKVGYVGFNSQDIQELTKKPKYSCVHAEMNCLVKNRVVDDMPKIMICSKQPCAMCASLIVNSRANIIEVWYLEEYWDNTGIDILINANICVKKLVEYENNKFCFDEE